MYRNLKARQKQKEYVRDIVFSAYFNNTRARSSAAYLRDTEIRLAIRSGSLGDDCQKAIDALISENPSKDFTLCEDDVLIYIEEDRNFEYI